MYFRHLAWLETPESEKKNLTRMGEMRVRREDPKLPPLTTAAYLAQCLIGVGIKMPAPSGGVAPLSALELRSWAEATSADLGPIDFQNILDASREYVAAYHEYNSKAVQPPWEPEITAEEKAARDAAEERFFDMMMGVKND
jgi:hypothetical protein